MARYFKFKTPDALGRRSRPPGCRRSRSPIDSRPLFQPVAIGTKRCGNRLAIQPMEGCDGTLDGRPDELTFRRYVRFGGGGAKLIWGEATAISDEGRANPRQLWLHDGSAAAIEDDARRLPPGTSRRVRQRRRPAPRPANHAFRPLRISPAPAGHARSPARPADRRQARPAAPVDDSYPLLTDDELKRIEDQYVAAARLAAKIGVDFIDLKQCHRYLLSELLAAKNRPGPVRRQSRKPHALGPPGDRPHPRRIARPAARHAIQCLRRHPVPGGATRRDRRALPASRCRSSRPSGRTQPIICERTSPNRSSLSASCATGASGS